jgi:hypothetical protein
MLEPMTPVPIHPIRVFPGAISIPAMADSAFPLTDLLTMLKTPPLCRDRAAV